MGRLQASSLVPPGFVVDSAVDDQDGMLLRVRSARELSSCPNCGTPSARIHSRYLRRLADLPMSGLRVGLVLLARRFRCEHAACVRKIFAERFDPAVLAPGHVAPDASIRLSIVWRLRSAAGRPPALLVG